MTKRERLIILLILLSCLAAAGIIYLLNAPNGNAAYAVISVDGKVVIRRSLLLEGEFTVPEVRGMVFEIKDGGVRVKSSDCPDKICVKTGFAVSGGLPAVCMPNKVIVTVEGDPDEG